MSKTVREQRKATTKWSQFQEIAHILEGFFKRPHRKTVTEIEIATVFLQGRSRPEGSRDGRIDSS